MRRYDDVYEVERERDGHGDFFMGALVGAAVGAAVALLYAPVRGREARDMIGARVQEGLTRASATVDTGRELAEKGRDVLAKSRELVSEASDTLVKAVAEGRNAYQRVKANS